MDYTREKLFCKVTETKWILLCLQVLGTCSYSSLQPWVDLKMLYLKTSLWKHGPVTSLNLKQYCSCPSPQQPGCWCPLPWIMREWEATGTRHVVSSRKTQRRDLVRALFICVSCTECRCMQWELLPCCPQEEARALYVGGGLSEVSVQTWRCSSVVERVPCLCSMHGVML